MGTIINSIAIENVNGKNGIVQLVATAATICLHKAGAEIDALGMLINVGVYSENHLKEPALALLVLKRLLNQNKRFKTHAICPANLLSFDMHNGGGGIINAIQVMDGFIISGEIEHGLIVSGDIKPRTGTAENYHYSTGAAAILLSKKSNKPGFVAFKTETFPEFKNDFSSSSSWEDGSLKLQQKQSNDYLDKTINCTAKVIALFFEEECLSWNDIGFVCTSQSPKGFAFELQKKLQVKEKIIQLNDEVEIYSSGLLFSIQLLFKSQKFSKVNNILFVTAGAGITVSLAYYKNR